MTFLLPALYKRSEPTLSPAAASATSRGWCSVSRPSDILCVPMRPVDVSPCGGREPLYRRYTCSDHSSYPTNARLVRGVIFSSVCRVFPPRHDSSPRLPSQDASVLPTCPSASDDFRRAESCYHDVRRLISSEGVWTRAFCLSKPSALAGTSAVFRVCFR